MTSPKQFTHGTRAQWTASGLVLREGQLGYVIETDGTITLLFGDGLSLYTGLPGINGVGGSSSGGASSAAVGTLANLLTTDKSNLVNAINEVRGRALAGAVINDGVAASNTTYSGTHIDSAIATAVAGLVASAPALLNTLKELADSIGDDPNYAATTATALGNRLRVDTNAQGLTAAQQANGLANLGAASTASVTAAIATASSDATTKANAAQSAAVSTAATAAASGDAAVKAALQTLPVLVQPNHLRRWRVALASTQFAQTAVFCEGDSITAGYYSGNELATTDAQIVKARQRGWAAQLRNLMNAHTGLANGEGWVWFAFEDTRWTYATATPSRTTAGPVSDGARLVAGNSATATGQDFTNVDVIAFTGGGTTHPPRILVDGTEITPSALPAAGKAGTVSAAGWVARGTNTTVTNTGTRDVTLTAVAAGAVVADIAASLIPVTPLAQYMFTAAYKTTANARQAGVNITWYDSTSTIIGSETSVINATSTVGAYAQTTAVVSAPAGAATARFTLRSTSTLNANETIEFLNFDMIPVVALNPTGTTTQWSYRFACTSVASGLHTIVVQPPVVNQADLAALILRKRTDAGVVVHQVGRAGSTTSDHLGTTTSLALTAAQQSTLLYGLFEMPQGVVPISLRIIALGTNEIGQQTTTPAQYRANLKVLTDRTSAAGGCSLIVAGSRFSETLAANLGQQPTYPEEDYYAQAKDLANTDDHVAFIDLSDSWGTSTQSNNMGFKNNAGGFGIHPTLAGHGDYARIIFYALTRQIMVPIP